MVRPAMRLVSLCLVEDPNSTLTFHPRLTVVFGLTPEARSFLTEALSLMVNGQSAGVFAQVDVDGTLIDVGPGYRRVPAPIQVVDSVIHAQDLLEPRMGVMGHKVADPQATAAELPDQLVKAKRQHQAAMVLPAQLGAVAFAVFASLALVLLCVAMGVSAMGSGLTLRRFLRI